MAYQLVNLTTCKPFNRQFRQRVESVKAWAHNASTPVISPQCCAFSQCLGLRWCGAWVQKKAAALKSKTCSS